ncbi:MAG: AAA family ATPase [Bacteroidales bacterium]|nr:AAA family ATPase [Bacteroidales bacterium]
MIDLLMESNSDSKGGFFAFEEPETHLHPSAQLEMYQKIRNLSNKDVQVFITTHSPSIVSQCNVNDLIQVVKEGDFAKVNQLSSENADVSFISNVIQDLGIGPNDSLSQYLSHTQSLFLVEGKNDIYTFNVVLKRYNEERSKKSQPQFPTFEELKCTMIPIGGCSSVEDWSKFNIVTKLNKPFLVLLDSDKKQLAELGNQQKLQNIFQDLDNRILSENKTKIKFSEDCFRVLKRRELENYLKPEAIEKFYCKKKAEDSISQEKKDEILKVNSILGETNPVDIASISFIYDNEIGELKAIRNQKIDEAKNAIPKDQFRETVKAVVEQVKNDNPISDKIARKVQEYQREYNALDNPSEFPFREWILCKYNSINIQDYEGYKDVIGKRAFIYCRLNKIDLDEYKTLKKEWLDPNYLVTYLINKSEISQDIKDSTSIADFEAKLTEVEKELMLKREEIKASIKNTTIPEMFIKFEFSEEIKKNWNYVDVPLAVYCTHNQKKYNDGLDKKLGDSAKKDINEYFFEEENVKFEDIDFSYGDSQDEFLDIYNYIKVLSSR